MVLALKTHRLMEKNQRPRNKTMFTLKSKNTSQGSQESSIGKRWSLQSMVLEKVDSHMQKNEASPISYHYQTLTQNRLKTSM